MSEKMRGALFNVLGDISGLTIFDAYAGSGAIGLEAISRDAQSVLFCDTDRWAVKTITNNVKSLRVGNLVRIINVNSSVYIEEHPELFDIVICDPPYDIVKSSQLVILSNGVKPEGLYVLSLPPSYQDLSFEGFELLLRKTYGDSVLLFFRKQK